MAEAVGLVGSIIAILELSAKVLGYLNDVQDASRDRARCALEVANVHGLLEKLRYRLEERNDPDSWFRSARDIIDGGLLKQFEDALMKLHDGLTSGGRFRRAADALRWKFKKEEVHGILNSVARLNMAMVTALQMDQFEILRAVQTDTKHLPVMHSMLEDAQQQALARSERAAQKALVDWLSSSDYPAEYATKLKERQDGTGKWFLRSREFRSWLATPKMTLMCQGGRGTGKSTLSAIAIEHLLSKKRSENTAAVWVFIDHKNQEGDTIKYLLAALLKQLVQNHTQVAQHVRLLFEHHAADESEIQEEEVLGELGVASETLTTMYIVVDALDECINDNQRNQLLQSLQSLQLRADVRLLLTSRTTPSPLQEALTKEIKAQAADLKRYVAGQTKKLPQFVQRSRALRILVQDSVVEAAGDMFLLARLYLEAISDQMTEKELRLMLSSLGTSEGSLDQAYRDVISRIESQSPKRKELAKRALSWLTLARRPLTEKELVLALAVEPDTKALDSMNMHEMEVIRSVCAGLIDVEIERRFVRLVHRTAYRYLDRLLDEWYPYARLEVARTCITYLTYETFSSGRCSSKEAMKRRYRENEFLLYAAEYWGAHALGVEAAICNDACSFLLDENLYSSAAQAVFVSKQPLFWDDKEHLQDRSLTAAQYLARYNLCEIMQQYLRRLNGDTTAILNHEAYHSGYKSNRRGTPLAIAAMNGDVRMMDVLIRNGARDGGEIMRRAVARNQIEVVMYLLDTGITIDEAGTLDETALSLAISKGHSEIVSMLLERHADIRRADSSQSSGSVLMTAVLANNACIVKLLLRAGANPCKGGPAFDNPLEAATHKGHSDIVKVLLEEGSVQKDRHMMDSALHIAAAKGRKDIVRSLLESHANPDVVVNDCNSVEAAANNGHQELVRMLYSVVRDKKGQTLDDYLARAQEVASWPTEPEDDSSVMTDSELEDDVELNGSAWYNGAIEEQSLKSLADEMNKRNRWTRTDTLPASESNAFLTHGHHWASSSMGVYDDDSDGSGMGSNH